MRKNYIICAALLFSFLGSRAQADTAALAGVFGRITTELKNYRPDTSAVPQDRFTRKIVELRQLRGGFNIDEAIRFKMEEEESKNPGSRETALMKEQFTSGPAQRWLENATIWVYRRQFTYKEVKKLVKFYRTSAGQKLASAQPLVMVETLAAATMIQETLMASQKNKQ